MGLLDRLTTTRTAPAPVTARPVPAPAENTFAVKALRKFLSSLTSCESPVLVDLGPVVGSNVSFFGEQLGCKIFVEDLFADVERHARERRMDALPALFEKRLPQAEGSVDGVLCWDLIDYLDRPSAKALASALTRVLKPQGALHGFFGTTTAQPAQGRYTKYLILDQTTLKFQPYAAARGRQPALQNRDIIKLFDTLRVSDSFLLQNNLREILFRKN